MAPVPGPLAPVPGRTARAPGPTARIPGPTARLALGAAVIAGVYVVLLGAGDLDHNRPLLAAVVLPAWLVFTVATRWSLRGSTGTLSRPVAAVVLLAALVQLPALAVAPRASNDAYRYVWDGRVQLSGVSPYRYAPLDDRLASLRDPLLFNGIGPNNRSGVATSPVPTTRAGVLRLAHDDARTRINRPAVPTIYPPLAQAWFALVAAVTPWQRGTLGLQVGSALLAVAVAAMLAVWLRRAGRDPLGALWWAWCPLVVLEAGNGAHVDIVATALLVLALLVWSGFLLPARWLRLVTGALLGAAVAVKLTPALLLPAFTPLRRPRGGGWRSLVVPLTALGTVAAAYLPYALVAGTLVAGYLPGYLREEGGANRAAVLRLLLPDGLVTPAMLLALVALGTGVLWSAHGRPTPLSALVLLGGAFLVTTPSYPWYALPVVALAVLAGRLEWLAVPVAAYIAYAAVRVPPVTGLAYLLATAVIVGAATRRRHGAPLASLLAPGRFAHAEPVPDPVSAPDTGQD